MSQLAWRLLTVSFLLASCQSREHIPSSSSVHGTVDALLSFTAIVGWPTVQLGHDLVSSRGVTYRGDGAATDCAGLMNAPAQDPRSDEVLSPALEFLSPVGDDDFLLSDQGTLLTIHIVASGLQKGMVYPHEVLVCMLESHTDCFATLVAGNFTAADTGEFQFRTHVDLIFWPANRIHHCCTFVSRVLDPVTSALLAEAVHDLQLASLSEFPFTPETRGDGRLGVDEQLRTRPMSSEFKGDHSDTGNLSDPKMYYNLSCAFEWSKYSCAHQGDCSYCCHLFDLLPTNAFFLLSRR